MKNKIIFISLLAIIFTSAVLMAQEEVSYPSPRDYVNDFAGVINQQDENTINAFARELDNKTTAQVAVVTIPTTKPLTIEQYAVGLFEKWGIGSKAKDNGVLMLMAVNDKKVRIETGYGLEGALPDAICNQIIYQVMIPKFKAGQISQGLLLGALAVSQIAAKEYNVELTGVSEYAQAIPLTPSQRSPLAVLLRTLGMLALFILFFGLRSGLLFYFLLGGMGHRRGGMWYGTGYGGTGGGFSGGFGGFGGGLSGGGGASGGW